MPFQTDIIYFYDGSFDGLLCCVFESVYCREMPQDIQSEEDAQPTLFSSRYVDTDLEKAKRVRMSIPKKIGANALSLVQDVFCSCVPGREMRILRFLLLGYKIGQRVLFMPGHEDVHPMLAAQLFLKNEAHRFVEFIRFSDHGGVLTACISPKSFVLPYIQNHFCDRYSIETFLIYDRTHHAALIWKEKRASIVPLDNFEPPPPDSNEQQYRILWKRFYDTIAIPDRENPRCRMNHCPKRYWPDMLEMSADVPKFVASDSPALKK